MGRETIDRQVDPTESGYNQSFALLFTWLVFLTMSIAAVGYVASFGGSVPFGDDWAIVPTVCDSVPADVSWYFHPHNGHRYPVTRLAMAAAWNLSRGDVRWGLIFNTVTYIFFVGAATWLIVGRRKRNYTDATIPLVMLNLAHGWNMIWWIQSFFLWCGCLSVIVIASFFAPGVYRKRAGLCLLSLVLVGLSWQGAMGAIMAPVLAVGFAFHSWRECRFWPRKCWVVATVAISCAGAGFLFFDMVGQPAEGAQHTSFLTKAATTIQFLSTSMGWTGIRLSLVAGVAIVVLLLLIVIGSRDNHTRFSVLVGSLSVLAVGACIAVSRPSGLAIRYSALSGDCSSEIGFW